VAAPNFEVPAGAGGTNTYQVVARATANGQNTDQLFEVSVTDVNEAPVITSAAAQNLAENSGSNAVVVTLARTDDDSGDTVTWSRVIGAGDTDNALFNTNGADLRLTTDTNFETPICGDNVCQVRVRATDAGGLTAELAITITITNVNEAPVITTTAAQNFAEDGGGNAVVVALASTDDDAGDTATWSIVAGAGGTNNDQFNVA